MSKRMMLLVGFVIFLIAIPVGVFTYRNLFRYETTTVLGMEKALIKTNIITNTVYVRHPETLEWILISDFESVGKQRAAEATSKAYVESMISALKQTNARIEASEKALDSFSLEEKKEVLSGLSASFGVGYGDLNDTTAHELDEKLRVQILGLKKSASDLEEGINERNNSD